MSAINEEEYETIDVVSIDDMYEKFPWFTLSEYDLQEKLELLYNNYNVPETLPRSLVRLLRDYNKEPITRLDYCFKHNLVTPVVSESIIVNDVSAIPFLQKKTFSHRPLVSAVDDQGIRKYGNDIYIQNFTNETVTYNVTMEKEVIPVSDIKNFPNALDSRHAFQDETIALVGFIIHPEKIVNRNIRRMIVGHFYSHKFYSAADTSAVLTAMSILQYIDSVIENYSIGYILSYAANVKTYPPVLFQKDNFYPVIAKVLRENNYYPFLSDTMNGYNGVMFITELLQGIDSGNFGLAFTNEIGGLIDPDQTEKSLYEFATKKIKDPKSLKSHKEFDIYNHIITNNTISTKKAEVTAERDKKDQIYRTLILSIYGTKRYLQLLEKAAAIKNSTFFDLVTQEEVNEITDKYAEIIRYQEDYATIKCGHKHLRREYDLLGLQEKSKHSILLRLVNEYSSSARTQTQRNKRQIICKNDGMIIACEHEIALANWAHTKGEVASKLMAEIEKKFICEDESFDSGTCNYCGRRIEETKVLINVTSFDAFNQPTAKFRVSLKETKEIEDSIIRAISKTEPLKGVDELTQRMSAVYSWDDVRRILSSVEMPIVEYYSRIESKRDSLERIYKGISKVCVIYAHIVYEATTFRPESEEYLMTPEYPWDETAENRTVEAFLKRALFFIRLRFWNIANDARKVSKTMLKDYLISIYKKYISDKKALKMDKAVTNVDKWSGVFYKMSHTDIVAARLASLDAPKNKMLAAMLENFWDDYNATLPRNTQEFINFSMNKLIKQGHDRDEKRRETMVIVLEKKTGHTFVKNFKDSIIDPTMKYRKNKEIIKPVAYNEHGVAQKWVKIIIRAKIDDNDAIVHGGGKRKSKSEKSNAGAKHERVFTYSNDDYTRELEMYKLFYKNSYNPYNVVSKDFIPLDHPGIISIDYENQEGILKSKLAKEEYSSDTQETIRERIEKQKTIQSMYEYQMNTQNQKFFKALKENVTRDNIRGYIVKDYELLLDIFTKELSLDAAKVNNHRVTNIHPEEKNKLPVLRKKTSEIILFKDLSLLLVTELSIALKSISKETQDIYYQRLQILGRKTIQEQEELDQYIGISEYLRGLPNEDIITIHTSIQIDRVNTYIKQIYQTCNILYYAQNAANPEKDLYNTFHGRYLIKYAKKFDIPIQKIRKIVRKIRKKKMRKLSRDKELAVVFAIFVDLCVCIIKINGTAAQMMREIIDLFLEQDRLLNYNRRLIDYQAELNDALKQFKYDSEKLRKKMAEEQNSATEFFDDSKEYYDENNDAYIEPTKNSNRDEYSSAFREYSNDYMRLTELASDYR